MIQMVIGTHVGGFTRKDYDDLSADGVQIHAEAGGIENWKQTISERAAWRRKRYSEFRLQ